MPAVQINRFVYTLYTAQGNNIARNKQLTELILIVDVSFEIPLQGKLWRLIVLMPALKQMRFYSSHIADQFCFHGHAKLVANSAAFASNVMHYAEFYDQTAANEIK